MKKMGIYFLLNSSLAQTTVASPSPLLNSWTAPTPSQRPRDLVRSAGWALVAAGWLWGRGAGDGARGQYEQTKRKLRAHET